MSVRAVILDVYGTLIEVSPPPLDAEVQWQRLFRDFFPGAPPPDSTRFAAACQQAVAVRHVVARDRGIPFPEILWPEVIAEVLPGFTRLSASDRDEFIFREIQTRHSTKLANGAAETLREFASAGLTLGIASNAQSYSRRELDEALRPAELSLSLFAPDLCFWSFEHGFSKPDPHVFRILSTRLAARDIHASETLMVGDRFDNDIEPARAQGWQTCHLRTEDERASHGQWHDLLSSLAR